MPDTSAIDFVPKSPFKTILNFRDVGHTMNLLQTNIVLQEGRLYRSARPDDANQLDRTALTEKYHIASILDLRSTTEHIRQAQKLQFNNDTTPSPPLRIPNIIYYDISLNGPAFERALIWQLKWWSLAKLITFLLSGYRLAAISILGREVMTPHGLTGLGILTLLSSGPELRSIVTLFADSDNYPIVIHCTQGKDRTGLAVLILLMLLEVPLDALAADYAASERELVPEMEARIAEMSEIGLGAEFASCPPGFVEDLSEHIKENYGGVQGYLRGIGVDKETQEKIRKNMLTGRN